MGITPTYMSTVKWPSINVVSARFLRMPIAASRPWGRSVSVRDVEGAGLVVEIAMTGLYGGTNGAIIGFLAHEVCLIPRPRIMQPWIQTNRRKAHLFPSWKRNSSLPDGELDQFIDRT